MIKINGKVIEVNKFPDGTLLLKTNPTEYLNTIGNDIYFTWFFENNEELMTLMFLAKHFKEKTYCTLHLEMPYIPNARMDRVKTKEDVFTLKYFAEFINSLNFDSVIALDPHSSVSGALFNNFYGEMPTYFIKKAIDDCHPNILFYPDEGAMKRYSGLVSQPYAFGIKKRDWETGKIQGLDVAGNVEQIKDSKILIVDDICSKGGTFYHSAKKLKELGAKEIYLYITHCENTILEGDLLTSGLIEKVYTTNSIFTKEHKMIEVFEL